MDRPFRLVLGHDGSDAARRALGWVVGFSHRGVLGELLTGSVEHGLLHRSQTPVVVVP